MDERFLEMAEAFQASQLQLAIEKARKINKIEGGQCLNCHEILSNNKKFCDDGCREDYELREKVRRNTYAS